MQTKKKMIRLFNNLLKNAIQAIPNNTKGTVHIELSLQNNLACVSVSDTGVGIPLEIQNRMFEPYFTTKKYG
jgi:signal transduction histidine kinase